MPPALTCEILLEAYANGYFPMAQRRDDPQLYWFHPEKRGILPLDTFHIPRRLARTIRRRPFTVTLNRAFPEVIRACAAADPTAAREDSWINDAIVRLYIALWEQGAAHSVECWEEERLIGGLYGVSLGKAFFGESMFSRRPDASKIALAHLVEWLREKNYRLLDTQFVNPHLRQFGAIEITREEYMERLKEAISAG